MTVHLVTPRALAYLFSADIFWLSLASRAPFLPAGVAGPAPPAPPASPAPACFGQGTPSTSMDPPAP
eukprot:1179072-Prorocentrum_minimum.AAC.2